MTIDVWPVAGWGGPRHSSTRSAASKQNAPNAISAFGDAALHGAMNARPQKGDLGLAIEWRKRRLQETGAEAGRTDLIHRRPPGLIPGHVETIVRHHPRNLQQPARGGERAILSGIGRKLVEHQRQADRKLCRKVQRLAIQREANMPVRAEFGKQQVPDLASRAVDT